MLMTLTNSIINEYIETLQAETQNLHAELENALNKKERSQILRVHTNIERIIKLLYTLRSYDEE